MPLYALIRTTLLLLTVALVGCTKSEAPAPSVPAKQEITLEAVSTQGKGFAVGALMSANTVYVFFDPQCPHCGQLWQAALPLQAKAKFVWIPIGMIGATSRAQGAALLTAANPGTLMSEHEKSLLEGKGGISASASVAPEVEKSIKSNTDLWAGFGAESVPFLVAKNQKTGQVVSREGAMGTAALADFLGLDAH